MNKLFYTGVVMLSLGAVGTLLAVGMEVGTGEPVYWLLMKIAAGLFGIGGGLIGLASIARGGR